MSARREIAIVFDGPPGPEAGRFVEVEVDGASVSLGRWEHRSSPLGRLRWELRFTAADVERATAGGPWLDHVYNGPAIRLTGHEWASIRAETISGAFAALYRDERCAIIDNGERGDPDVWQAGGTGRWLVTCLERLVKP